MSITIAETLIGKKLDDPAVTADLDKIDGNGVLKDSHGTWCWASKTAGVEISAYAEDKRIHTVFLQSEGIEGYAQYKGPLPGGIDFSWSREQIVEQMGPPARSNDAHDRWDRDDYSIVARYDKQGHFFRVTVTAG